MIWKQTYNISEVSVGVSAEGGIYLVMMILDISLWSKICKVLALGIEDQSG